MTNSQEYVASGMTSEFNFETADAILNYSLALRDDACNIDALHGKARCLILYIDEPERLKQGLKIVDKLIDIHKISDFSLYQLKAKFLWRLKEYQKALHWIEFTKSTFDENEDPELLFTQARILVSSEMRRWPTAEKIANKLSERQRHFIKGRISIEKKDFHDAKTNFEKSFEGDFKITDDAAVDNYLICSIQTRPENFDNTKNYEENSTTFKKIISVGERFLQLHGKSIISWKIIRNIHQMFLTEIRLLYRHELYYEKDPERLKQGFTTTEFLSSITDQMIAFVQNVQKHQNEFFQSDQKEKQNNTMRILLENKLIAYNEKKEYDQALVALDEYIAYCDKDDEFHSMFYNYWKGQTLCSMKNWNLALSHFDELKMDDSKNNLIIKHSRVPLQLEKNALSSIINCHKNLGNGTEFEYYTKIYEKRKEFLTRDKVRAESVNIDNQILPSPKDSAVIRHPGKEGSRLEFKSSFFIHGSTVTRDGKTIKITNDKMRESLEIKGQEDIAATVCSFLNSEGGDLYIGVDDKTKICYGLEEEFKRTKNLSDVYTQTVRNNVQKTFREHYTNYLTFDFYDHHDPDTNEPMQLYQIHVEPLLNTEKQPCSVKHSEGKEVIYFREGDSDKRFDGIDGTVEWYKRIEINRNRIS